MDIAKPVLQISQPNSGQIAQFGSSQLYDASTQLKAIMRSPKTIWVFIFRSRNVVFEEIFLGGDI